MLEGTKHEKAVLVVLAYIIGLTSGFIGFGISDVYRIEATEISAAEEVEGDNVDYSVYYEDGQLVVQTKEGSVVLSVHIDKLGDEVPETLAIQGHHITPPVYLASPEGRYVYFCEQHLGADNCTNLLFDKETVVIYYIKLEDDTLVTPASMAASAYWSANGLNIGDYASKSPEEPWNLVQKSEEVQ